MVLWAHWCTFVLRTAVFALGAARRAHAAGARRTVRNGSGQRVVSLKVRSFR